MHMQAITGKVCSAITHNSSNFVKTFSVYSLLGFSDSTATIAEDAEEETEEIIFENVDELLTF